MMSAFHEPVYSPMPVLTLTIMGPAKILSPLTGLMLDHIAPELLWLETKWASLVSFGVTVDLLRGVLPISERMIARTVCNYPHRTARRLENELADEHFSLRQASVIG
jgi:hypothetical protein